MWGVFMLPELQAWGVLPWVSSLLDFGAWHSAAPPARAHAAQPKALPHQPSPAAPGLLAGPPAPPAGPLAQARQPPSLPGLTCLSALGLPLLDPLLRGGALAGAGGGGPWSGQFAGAAPLVLKRSFAHQENSHPLRVKAIK